MARDLTAAVITESQKLSGAKPILLVKLSFDSGAVRVWNGRGDFTFDSETYLGVGDLGNIAGVDEGIDQRAFGISMTLSGIPPALLSIALSEEVQGRKAEVWLGFLDSSYVLIVDPMLLFRGSMDTMDILAGDEGVITVTAESRLIDWNRPRIRRYTNGDQQERFPLDRGFEFTSQTTDREINWGVPTGGQRGGRAAAGQGGGHENAGESRNFGPGRGEGGGVTGTGGGGTADSAGSGPGSGESPSGPGAGDPGEGGFGGGEGFG